MGAESKTAAVMQRVGRYMRRRREGEDRPSLLGSVLGGAAIGGALGTGVSGVAGYRGGGKAYDAQIAPISEALKASLSDKPAADLPSDISAPAQVLRYQHSPPARTRLLKSLPSRSDVGWERAKDRMPSGALIGAGAGSAAGVLRYLLSR